MVDFAKVRLSGFKSFIDPTELEIAPGMTGVVGPNGCGKSNILEALRWCMGEGSARQLRGGGMDDVIFNGTAERPARNIAEVAIHLDNSGRNAPAAFNAFDEIEVVRRIERESGSAYRVNGRDVRARDVQLLFADLSTGARSTAIVSQGRIGSLINAKPEARRLLIEEAAGITGLHSRRHEAELRLRAAETNLERLDDIVTALGGQLQGLKRQARQATRYRNLSEQIRSTEAMVLHLRWVAAGLALDEARAQLAAIGEEVAALSAESARHSAQSADLGARLPALREAEAKAAAALQRHLVARDALDVEEERLTSRRAELEARIAQVDADLAREQAHHKDAEAALARLQAEAATLDGERDDGAAIEAARAERDALRGAVEANEAEATTLTRQIATRAAERDGLARRAAELAERLEHIQARHVAAEAELATLPRDSLDAETLAAEQAVTRAETALRRRRTDAAAADGARDTAREAADVARTALQEASSALDRIRAEQTALRSLLDQPAAQPGTAVVDATRVTPGYEAALGAALGEDLEASLDAEAPVHWQETEAAGDAPPLPAGVKPLSWFVEAPAALTRRLDQIGVVEDDAAGPALATALVQGQRLVGRSGALWRWDGLTMRAGAPTAAARRLEQRNRLSDLERDADAGERQVAARRAEHDAAQQAVGDATAAARAAADAVQAAFDAAARAKDARAKAAEQALVRDSRRDALVESRDRLAADAAETEGKIAEARAALDATDAPDADEAALEQLRTAIAAERARLSDAETRFNRLEADAEARRRRQETVAAELAQWIGRCDSSHAQIGQLETRRAETEAALAETAARPEAIAAKRAALAGVIDEAEAARQTAATALADAENAVAEVDAALRRTDARLADARELRGRREGAVAQAEQTLGEIAARIRERLRCAPEQAQEVAGLGADETPPPIEPIEKKLERLLRERDGMGPVNHRAEQEAAELQEQIDTYESERADLIGAIERFRKAIAELNREGRERLLASFTSVNEHFKELFTRLFGGGRAHLTLSEGDDPLEAGLEVMASPPGKRLQALSLLSGGEQALTAVALVFAVFMTNPAPICILDEVDAPLDDANVDRFCTLLEDLAHASHTRFLVVTHHRMTMARMDRLYGVTMADRGVSRLVSVDLREAEALRDTEALRESA